MMFSAGSRSSSFVRTDERRCNGCNGVIKRNAVCSGCEKNKSEKKKTHYHDQQDALSNVYGGRRGTVPTLAAITREKLASATEAYDNGGRTSVGWLQQRRPQQQQRQQPSQQPSQQRQQPSQQRQQPSQQRQQPSQQRQQPPQQQLQPPQQQENNGTPLIHDDDPLASQRIMYGNMFHCSFCSMENPRFESKCGRCKNSMRAVFFDQKNRIITRYSSYFAVTMVCYWCNVANPDAKANCTNCNISLCHLVDFEWDALMEREFDRVNMLVYTGGPDNRSMADNIVRNIRAINEDALFREKEHTDTKAVIKEQRELKEAKDKRLEEKQKRDEYAAYTLVEDSRREQDIKLAREQFLAEEERQRKWEQSHLQPVESTLPDGQWACIACTYHNSQCVWSCAMCATPHPAKPHW